ncbi:MAG: hypothetical protein J6A87_00215 [Clostridia bacterium]|nr:hypothetical protein [Clostridia bacterium]
MVSIVAAGASPRPTEAAQSSIHFSATTALLSIHDCGSNQFTPDRAIH